MKKAGICMLLVIMLLATAVVPTYAALPEDNTVTPLWTNTNSVDYTIVFGNNAGNTGSCVVAKYSPKTFNVYTYVYVKSGSEWVYVTEAHATKTGMAIATSCYFAATFGAEFWMRNIFMKEKNLNNLSFYQENDFDKHCKGTSDTITKSTYEIIEECRCLDGLEYKCYGIAVHIKSDVDGFHTVIQTIGDITTDRDRLSMLVDQCNLLELSPLHLNDVIEDYLAN